MKSNVAEFLEFRFEKLKLLKRSDKGEVWLASSRQSGELVIIKRVALTGLPYDVLKNFSFKLPAKVIYCAEDATDTVIVEEFIQGENLFERIEQKNFLNELQAREILLQMCDGLKELHEQKIIHRDIKPSNLILQGERIRLIDFDAARIFKEDKEADTKLLGTRGYAPPEQFGHGQTDSRSDIYSLGITMKILLDSNCGERLKEILDKCTEYDPKNRYQSVDELKAALTPEEPEVELTPAESRRALFSLAMRVLWFIIRRSFRAELFILTIGIFLLASSAQLNSGENFQEVVESRAEEISEPEEISAPEENSQPAQAFKLPELVTPPQKELNLPTVEPPKEFTPPSRINFSDDDFKLPEVALPTAPEYELPKPRELPQKISSGLLKTELYLNGTAFNQFDYISEHIQITRGEWLQNQVRLRITNDTGKLWLNPKIKFILGQNLGDKVTDTKTLPTLAPGESADFVIPFNLLSISERPNTGAYFQIWLDGDESKMDEHYWSAWFNIID